MITRDQLTEAQLALLESIVLGTIAWTRLVVLAATGHTPETLAELYELELVEPWDLASGAVVTLTPIGAWLLGVELVEWQEDGFPEWTTIKDISAPLKLPLRPREVRLPFPDRLVDPHPGPEYMLDETTGEEVRLFRGDATRADTALLGGIGGQRAGTGGVPVKIEPRLAKKTPTKRVHRKRSRKPKQAG